MSKKTVICLSWHPGSSASISAGGFTRFFEIAKRSNHKLIIIDKYPSFYSSLSSNSHSVIEYKIPNLSHFPALVSAILDRILSLGQMLKILWKLPRQEYLIYVPASEIPQLSVAGVIAKFKFKAKLTLVNLNLNVIPIDWIINLITHRLADNVITISRDLQSQLEKTGIHAGFINGVGFDDNLYQKSRIQKKLPNAIYIGRHDPQKGIFDLLQIWANVIKLLPDQKGLKLITAGNIPPHYKDKIEKMVTSLNIKNSISFLGSISQDKKIKLLQGAKVSLFPSHNEGWGIVPMESLACGIPVVAYNLPVFHESIGQSVGFKTVKLGDLSTFAQVTAGLLSHPPLKFTWRSKMNWDDVARREWEIICQN